tara:strand:- start:7 stop:363 length:357 start_codon:yes stop_codon:yes gene_type:complete
MVVYDNGDPFDAYKAGFKLSFKAYIKGYVANPNTRDKMLQVIYNKHRSLLFYHSTRYGKAPSKDLDALQIPTKVKGTCSTQRGNDLPPSDEFVPKETTAIVHDERWCSALSLSSSKLR